MKKLNCALGGGVFLGGAAYLISKHKKKKLRKKYNLLDEISDKDLFVIPKFVCNPTGFMLMNKLQTGG